MKISVNKEIKGLPENELIPYLSILSNKVEIFNKRVEIGEIVSIYDAIDSIFDSFVSGVILPNELFAGKHFMSSLICLLQSTDLNIVVKTCNLIARIIFFTEGYSVMIDSSILVMICDLTVKNILPDNTPFITVLSNVLNESKQSIRILTPVVDILLKSIESRFPTRIEIAFIRQYYESIDPNTEEFSIITESLLRVLECPDDIVTSHILWSIYELICDETVFEHFHGNKTIIKCIENIIPDKLQTTKAQISIMILMIHFNIDYNYPIDLLIRIVKDGDPHVIKYTLNCISMIMEHSQSCIEIVYKGGLFKYISNLSQEYQYSIWKNAIRCSFQIISFMPNVSETPIVTEYLIPVMFDKLQDSDDELSLTILKLVRVIIDYYTMVGKEKTIIGIIHNIGGIEKLLSVGNCGIEIVEEYIHNILDIL